MSASKSFEDVYRTQTEAIERLTRERDELQAKCDELLELLSDWLGFASDVSTGCAAGQEWLDELRTRTEIAKHRGQKP